MSTPNSQESHRGMPPERELAPLHPRDQYLADHPEARAHEEAFEAALKSRYAAWKPRVRPMLQIQIDLAEEARQMGLLLIEFVDTLPGKKLTVDFYEHFKRKLFLDERGQSIPLPLLEWFMKTARNNELPITTYRAAEKYNQPLLIEAQAQAVAEGGEVAGSVFEAVQTGLIKQRVTPKDAWTEWVDWVEFPELETKWKEIKASPHHFVNGHLRPDLVEIYAAQFKEKKRVLDEFWKELGI